MVLLSVKLQGQIATCEVSNLADTKMQAAAPKDFGVGVGGAAAGETQNIATAPCPVTTLPVQGRLPIPFSGSGALEEESRRTVEDPDDEEDRVCSKAFVMLPFVFCYNICNASFCFLLYHF